MNFENILNKYKEMTNSGQFTDSIFSETLVQLINKPETNIETSIMTAINTYLPYISVSSIIFDNSNENKDKHLVSLQLNYSINFSAVPTVDTLTVTL